MRLTRSQGPARDDVAQSDDARRDQAQEAEQVSNEVSQLASGRAASDIEDGATEGDTILPEQGSEAPRAAGPGAPLPAPAVPAPAADVADTLAPLPAPPVSGPPVDAIPPASVPPVEIAPSPPAQPDPAPPSAPEPSNTATDAGEPQPTSRPRGELPVGRWP